MRRRSCCTQSVMCGNCSRIFRSSCFLCRRAFAVGCVRLIRDGAFHLLRRARRMFPFIERIFADGGYSGQKMVLVVWRTGSWKLQIVKRSSAPAFEVLPKRWIVERTFAWMQPQSSPGP